MLDHILDWPKTKQVLLRKGEGETLYTLNRIITFVEQLRISREVSIYIIYYPETAPLVLPRESLTWVAKEI